MQHGRKVTVLPLHILLGNPQKSSLLNKNSNNIGNNAWATNHHKTTILFDSSPKLTSGDRQVAWPLGCAYLKRRRATSPIKANHCAFSVGLSFDLRKGNNSCENGLRCVEHEVSQRTRNAHEVTKSDAYLKRPLSIKPTQSTPKQLNPQAEKAFLSKPPSHRVGSLWSNRLRCWDGGTGQGHHHGGGRDELPRYAAGFRFLVVLSGVESVDVREQGVDRWQIDGNRRYVL